MTPCLWFSGYIRPDGYGQLEVAGKKVLAHRDAFRKANGYMPDDKVRHMCHNPACVNPEHLVTGSQADNMADMVRAGRSYTCGGNRKLTAADIPKIRAMLADGFIQEGIGETFGVSGVCISNIATGRTWRHC